MKYFILLMLLSLNAHAIFDLKIAGQGRSYPGVGGSGILTAGLNIPIWGNVEPGNIAYGLLRFQSELSSSVVVSHQDHSVTFYPISFIGLGAGRKEMKSDFEEFVFYNCDQVRCIGEMNKDYLFGKMILGWGPLLTAFVYRDSRITYTDPENTGNGAGEYEFVTVVDNKEETSTNRMYFLGLRLGSNILGAQSRNVKFHNSQQEFNMHFLFYNMKFDNIRFTLGAGNLYTTTQKPGPTAVFNLTYTFWENKALF